MRPPTRYPLLLLGISFLFLLALALNVFLFLIYRHQVNTVASLDSEKRTLTVAQQQTTAELNTASTTLTNLRSELATLRQDYDELENDYREERGRNEDFEDQIRDISKTVGTLDKLSKTDRELLQKYSKVYFLNENYIPSALSDIPSQITLANRSTQEFHSKALPFLEKMIDAAKVDGIDLKVVSAYRSFTTQAELKGQYTVSYGSGANAFSADQGYSEHQLGTTVDLTIDSIGGAYSSFKDTEAYQWLLKNAYRFGFTESYPAGNSYYVYEPWHWRFVGEDLARDLNRADAHFYDWDQRKIDTYLVKIFD